MFRATSNFEIAKSFEQNRVYRGATRATKKKGGVLAGMRRQDNYHAPAPTDSRRTASHALIFCHPCDRGHPTCSPTPIGMRTSLSQRSGSGLGGCKCGGPSNHGCFSALHYRQVPARARPYLRRNLRGSKSHLTNRRSGRGWTDGQ